MHHNSCAGVIQALRDEVARLKRGDFTAEEFQNLCHNLPEDCTSEAFCNGCEEYQKKLFGESPITALRLEASRLRVENERLREALRWSLEFIRCNSRGGTQYPDFKNAEALTDSADLSGPFTIALAQAEILTEKLNALRTREREAKSVIEGLVSFLDKTRRFLDKQHYKCELCDSNPFNGTHADNCVMVSARAWLNPVVEVKG